MAPAAATGLPIRLSDGTGVASVDFVLKYDPALLTITQVSAGASMPAGTQVVANLGVPGTVTVAIASPTALGAGVRDIVSLTALVPTTAPYRAKEIIDISGVLVNEGAVPAVDDDGLHVVAYFGDTTGNGTYSSLDGQRVLRLAVSLDSGLAPFLLGDPAVIADITGNALVSAIDATRIFQEVVGIDRPEIPLHGNGSENAIRCVVTERKISGGTRSAAGKRARDTFLGLLKTCAKLGVSFWDYLGARLKIPDAAAVPWLPDLIRQRAPT